MSTPDRRGLREGQRAGVKLGQVRRDGRTQESDRQRRSRGAEGPSGCQACGTPSGRTPPIPHLTHKHQDTLLGKYSGCFLLEVFKHARGILSNIANGLSAASSSAGGSPPTAVQSSTMGSSSGTATQGLSSLGKRVRRLFHLFKFLVPGGIRTSMMNPDAYSHDKLFKDLGVTNTQLLEWLQPMGRMLGDDSVREAVAEAGEQRTQSILEKDQKIRDLREALDRSNGLLAAARVLNKRFQVSPSCGGASFEQADTIYLDVRASMHGGHRISFKSWPRLGPTERTAIISIVDRGNDVPGIDENSCALLWKFKCDTVKTQMTADSILEILSVIKAVFSLLSGMPTVNVLDSQWTLESSSASAVITRVFGSATEDGVQPDIVIVPLHDGADHWMLLVVFTQPYRAIFLDSLRGPAKVDEERRFRIMRQKLSDISTGIKNAFGSPVPQRIHLVVVKGLPSQGATRLCGIYVAYYAMLFMAGNTLRSPLFFVNANEMQHGVRPFMANLLLKWYQASRKSTPAMRKSLPPFLYEPDPYDTSPLLRGTFIPIRIRRGVLNTKRLMLFHSWAFSRGSQCGTVRLKMQSPGECIEFFSKQAFNQYLMLAGLDAIQRTEIKDRLDGGGAWTPTGHAASCLIFGGSQKAAAEEYLQLAAGMNKLYWPMLEQALSTKHNKSLSFVVCGVHFRKVSDMPPDLRRSHMARCFLGEPRAKELHNNYAYYFCGSAFEVPPGTSPSNWKGGTHVGPHMNEADGRLCMDAVVRALPDHALSLRSPFDFRHLAEALASCDSNTGTAVPVKFGTTKAKDCFGGFEVPKMVIDKLPLVEKPPKESLGSYGFEVKKFIGSEVYSGIVQSNKSRRGASQASSKRNAPDPSTPGVPSAKKACL